MQTVDEAKSHEATASEAVRQAFSDFCYAQGALTRTELHEQAKLTTIQQEVVTNSQDWDTLKPQVLAVAESAVEVLTEILGGWDAAGVKEFEPFNQSHSAPSHLQPVITKFAQGLIALGYDGGAGWIESDEWKFYSVDASGKVSRFKDYLTLAHDELAAYRKAWLDLLKARQAVRDAKVDEQRQQIADRW